MWVMSSDGKNLIDARYFHVARNIGGKAGEKFALQAFPAAAGVQSGYVCALFADEEKAVAELEKILAAIEAGDKVYRLSK